MRFLFPLALWLPLPGAADRCIPVDASRVFVRDVVPRIPALSGLPADLALGYAPAPGLTRWWKAGQIQAIASRHGQDLGQLPDFCVERPAAPWRAADVAATLAALLPEGARLELVDYCRLPAPRGELRFALSGLARPPAPRPESVLRWRGRVVFDDNRSAPFWASVRIAVTHKGIYAVRRIEQGRALQEEDVRLESREESIFSPKPEPDSARIIGRISRRSIPAGSALTEALFTMPREVNAGEAVQVEVQSGSTRLMLDAVAVNGGRSGERVLLRNQASGKQFRAKVEGRSRAVLELEVPDVEIRPPGAGTQSAAPSRPAAAGQGSGSAQAGPGDGRHDRSPHPGS